MLFNAVLDIQLHPGIADPQGSTIERALPTLGFDGISNVRAGQEHPSGDRCRRSGSGRGATLEVCDKFLTNPVIEGATINLIEAGKRSEAG